MPKAKSKKKKFIDPKNEPTQTFAVIQRSEKEPLAADSNAPQRILQPLESNINDILKKTCKSGDVNEQMDSLAKYLVLKNEEIHQRHEVAHLIETSLKEYFPECVSHLFGSSVNGVGFKESDVDIYLDLQKEPSLLKKSGREIGEKIVSILKKIPEITNVEGILGARIPIVRFVHVESNLKCDLSFHNMMSVMNSKFLKMCQQADPRYVPDFFLRGHSITTWTR